MFGSAGTALPSTGIGNIGAALGTPNARGTPNGSLSPGGAPQSQLGFLGQAPQPPQPQMQQAPQGPQISSQLLSQLHPQALGALRSLPPGVLASLHGAGLIHPGLMQHIQPMQPMGNGQ